MAQPQGSLQDKESAAFIVDTNDGGTNKRVQIMGGISATIIGDSITSGTVDGTASGTERTIVNNKKIQVLSAHDLSVAFTWLDFGTKAERVSTMVYTSATFPTDTITRTFSYTLTSGKYRLDTEVWTASNGG